MLKFVDKDNKVIAILKDDKEEVEFTRQEEYVEVEEEYVEDGKKKKRKKKMKKWSY